MKYYIAIDRGKFYKENERYLKIFLDNINHKLGEDNNLKSLCAFTMMHESKKTLKNFLVECGCLNKKDIHFDICFTYYKNITKIMDIPLKKDKKYFEVGRLIDIIMSYYENEYFFKKFLNYFNNGKYMPEGYYELTKAINNHAMEYIVRDKVTEFINDYCYRDMKLNFRSLYNIAMLTKTLDQKN